MNIGSIRLENNIFLAPMAGVTDRSFRMLCKEQGCGLSYTEMISVKGLHYENKRTKNLLFMQPEDKPVAVQLFGSDPGLMAEEAAELCKSGADIIDINMGCPTPKIVKNGDGCALMQKPALVAELIKKVSQAINVPLTVKMRKGWDQNSVNALEIAQIAEDNGADAVTVHGRTRDQFYSGTADWDIIADVKKVLSIPVIGNGDIFTPEDAKSMLEKTGCDAVMIGRGARGNPWIFKRCVTLISEGVYIELPDIKEVLAMIKRHTNLCIEHKGERVALNEMRKHVGWYLKGFRNTASLKNEANGTSTREQLFRLLEGYENELEEHR